MSTSEHKEIRGHRLFPRRTGFRSARNPHPRGTTPRNVNLQHRSQAMPNKSDHPGRDDHPVGPPDGVPPGPPEGVPPGPPDGVPPGPKDPPRPPDRPVG